MPVSIPQQIFGYARIETPTSQIFPRRLGRDTQQRNGLAAPVHAAKRNREATDGYRPVLRVLTRDLGNEIEIRIRDNGNGIAPDIRDKLFQPFVTTKPTGEGTGLGLSISYEIVSQQHGGSIEVDSELGAYTEFTVRLPRRNGRGVEERR